MPIVAFLRLEKIPGESTVVGHENEIDIQGFSWSESQTVRATGAGKRGRAEIGAMTIHKCYDAASPYLALAVMKGTALGKARLAVDRPGDQHFQYLTIKLTNTIITSYSILPPDPAATGQAGNRIAERFDITFGGIDIEYLTQNQDGSPGAQHQVEYDIAAAK